MVAPRDPTGGQALAVTVISDQDLEARVASAKADNDESQGRVPDYDLAYAVWSLVLEMRKQREEAAARG